MEALSVSSGMAAIEYSVINIAEDGNNIVSSPQLYGATYTLVRSTFCRNEESRGGLPQMTAGRRRKINRRKYACSLLRKRG